MKSNSEIINGDNRDFAEQNCCIEMNGKKFCSGGSWIMVNTRTKLREGILYLYRENHGEDKRLVRYFVGTWDGSKKVQACSTGYWRSNFGDERRSFSFRWDGIRFHGINAGDNDIVRCREYRRQ